MRLTGFEGRRALVTGAGGGIGRAISVALAEAGARVVATDLPAALAGLDLPKGVERRPLDVTDAATVEALVENCEALGPIDLFAGAAGILSTNPIATETDTGWARVLDVNLMGTVRITRALARHMAARKRGAMVVVSSNAAGIPRKGMAAYAASKAALTMYVRCLGLELAGQGVRCNVVAPGSTLTPMQTGMWADESGADAVIAGDLAAYKTGIPLRKLARPEDVAAAAMYLLSDEAGHVTMADLYVDGGATLRA